jgi:prepilin signal peptidase PulO-like enzyme (type II secretory pathway)
MEESAILILKTTLLILIETLILYQMNKKIKYDISRKNMIFVMVASFLVAFIYHHIQRLAIQYTYIGLITMLWNISVIDVKYLEVSNLYSFLVFICGIISSSMTGLIHTSWESTLIIGGISLLLLFSDFRIGGGDLKLISAISIWVPITFVTKWMMYVFLSGIVWYIGYRFILKKTAEDYPFVPAIMMGTWISLLLTK